MTDRRAIACGVLVLAASPLPAAAGIRTIDLSRARPPRQAPERAIAFDELDAHAVAAPPPVLPLRGRLATPAEGGTLTVDVPDLHAVEDIPGNEYPRKHTLYMNFVGAELMNGSDNSAENRSSLAKFGPYPAFSGGEQAAVSAAQEMASDVSAYGIRVVYLPDDRPPKTLPYTMAMVGGQWTDTNLEDSAAGVAPGTDCGALGQRHVVYTFASGGWSPTAIANVTAQEAGHAWGLDHSFNCSSVMSYCGGGNGHFSSTCDGLCEDACQGAAGCRSFHEMFCGEGTDQQNEHAELSFIFGGNEPDVQPPSALIESPVDGTVVSEGDDVDVRAVVSDDYGGYGWRFVITVDGEVRHDEPDYDREVDSEYRAALNLVGLEPGAYTVMVEVMDHAAHVASDSVSFVVEPEAGGAATDDAGADGSTGGDPPADTGEPPFGGSSSGGGEDSGGTAADAGIEPSAAAEDCACRASRPGVGGLPGLLAAVAVGRRRRRGRVPARVRQA